MLDDVFEIAADVLLGISERESLMPRTKRILEAVGLLLGLTSMLLFFVLK